MISKKAVEELLLKQLTEDYFIVDLKISSSNKIDLVIDRMDGVSIDDCINITRLIEKNLNRDEEDFELQVSSPGLGSPFKVNQQYAKNVGKEIECNLKNAKPVKGLLKNFDKENNTIFIETQSKEKIAGSKKKELVTKEFVIEINDIISAKNVVSFGSSNKN